MTEQPKVKEEWARFIMGQALAEIETVADIPRVMRKVEGTAVGTRKDLMKLFGAVVELKQRMLIKAGKLGKPKKPLCPRERKRINKKEHCAALILGICDGEPEKITRKTCMHPEEAA